MPGPNQNFKQQVSFIKIVGVYVGSQKQIMKMRRRG
jgi:hypothetical protein